MERRDSGKDKCLPAEVKNSLFGVENAFPEIGELVEDSFVKS